MKSLNTFLNEGSSKKCPKGHYYCFTDKKCKKIPGGYFVGRRGYLEKDDDDENGNGKKNGNGNGNGTGNGNSNGGNGGNGGGNGGGMSEELNKDDKPFVKKLVGKLRKGSKTHAKQADDLEKAMTEESNPRIPRKKGQPANSKKHSDLYTDENPKGTIHGLGFKDVATAKASVSKIRNSSRSHAHKIQAAVAMEQRAREMGKTSEAAVYRKYINSMKKKTKKMNEEKHSDHEPEMIRNQLKTAGRASKRIEKHSRKKDNFKAWVQSKITKASDYLDTAADYLDGKEMKKEAVNAAQQAAIAINMKKKGKKPKDMSEGSLHNWFKGSKSKDGKGGWVNVVTGGTCASDEPGEGTPKCVSSAKRASMTKAERLSAARRKKKADPGQQQKTGAAKPTYVSTDKPKKKMKEDYLDERLGGKGVSKKAASGSIYPGKKGDGDFPDSDRGAGNKAKRRAGLPVEKKSPTYKAYAANKKMSENYFNEAKDKKGKGSGTKDACYHKVKSRYSVWPSAYASGALVKCRKVGAANWGNKSKNEGFSPMQVAALEAAGMIEIKEGKKCWKGYKKAGTQKLFGKTYNRCVKAGDELNHDGEQLQEMNPSFDIKQTRTQKLQGMTKSSNPNEAAVAKKKLEQKQAKEPKLPTVESYAKVTEGVAFLKREKEKKKSKSEYLTQRDAGKLAKRKMAKKDQEKVNFLEPEETNESKIRLVKNGHTYKVVLTWRGKTYMVQMFVPSVSRPTRQQIEKEVQKLYPDAKVLSFLPRDLEPGEPTVMMGEEKRDEYGDIVGGPKISKKEKEKNLKKNEKDEDHTTTTSEEYVSKDDKKIKSERKVGPVKEPIPPQKIKTNRVMIAMNTAEEYVVEDDMKGMSVKSGHKRPTKAGAGMTKKGVEAYRRRNPGSKLKTAVTTKPSKLKKGSKAAKRRKSYCARSAGQMKKFPKAAKDPNSRLRQARRRWNC